MLTAIACTKFKDDSFISFRKPEKRLLGNWKIVAFEVDGADSLSNLFTYTNFNDCEFKFEYDKNNSVNKIEGCVDDWIINWRFSGRQFHVGDYFIRPQVVRNLNGSIYLIGAFATDYEVLKLYKNDFWIQKSFNNKNYLIKLKKQ
jgi:hypothetical protein